VPQSGYVTIHKSNEPAICLLPESII